MYGKKPNSRRNLAEPSYAHHFHAIVAQLRAVAIFQVGEAGLESLEPLGGRHELCSTNVMQALTTKSGAKSQ